MTIRILKCEWCNHNASQTRRLPSGRLTGVCLDHLKLLEGKK